MNATHYLILLLCIALPVLFLVWRHEAKKPAACDQRRFMVNKEPDDEKRAPGFLDLRNAQRLAAWQRRYIAAHPQTIVTQRFPSEELIQYWELPALLRRQA